MAWDGNGNFNPPSPPVFPAVPGEDILADYFNQIITSLCADGITATINRSGQNQPLANLPMGGFRHTNAADGVNPQDYATINQLNKAIPIGAILLWSGAANAIPTGWQLCDGTNGTPNLKNRFVVGAGDQYTVNATGGATSVTLGINQMPSHNHGLNDPTHAHGVNQTAHGHGLIDNGHVHGVPSGLGNYAVVAGGTGKYFNNSPNGNSYGEAGSTGTSGTGIQIVSGFANISIQGSSTGMSVQNNGSGQAFSILPPYFALCYIQRIS